MNAYLRLFELSRIALVASGFFLAYQQPHLSLLWLTAFVVVPLSGLTAIESLFLGRASTLSKQRETGSDYQTQSTLNNLSVALTGLLVLWLHLGANALLTIITVSISFFALSSLKHLLEFLCDRKHAIHLGTVEI